MLAIQSMLKEFNIVSNSIAKENIDDILNCLIFFIPRLFADRLSIDRKLKKNRNFFYAVNNENIIRFIQKNLGIYVTMIVLHLLVLIMMDY
ncbi:hypothetical protein G4V39_04540 [Thermosulfuriphilus ammonigenes]|uniref:Uncharacterized protein n=2 Tax=Thermosulfuriphilus ammonigenes TaxID=1936021 RepID=A0A6G7PVW5_9BACT|nr:hypothetical protein [Thermosulfuriphilus ammonigenes]QIJ71588.1 hypothetical protein G4V39_04540 [Thermosulfuriphilus ammonigenes]